MNSPPPRRAAIREFIGTYESLPARSVQVNLNTNYNTTITIITSNYLDFFLFFNCFILKKYIKTGCCQTYKYNLNICIFKYLIKLGTMTKYTCWNTQMQHELRSLQILHFRTTLKIESECFCCIQVLLNRNSTDSLHAWLFQEFWFPAALDSKQGGTSWFDSPEIPSNRYLKSAQRHRFTFWYKIF